MARPDAPHVASPAELKERLEAERRGEPFLLLRDAEGQRIVPLRAAADGFSIGRDEKMDLALDDPQVSLLHAELQRVGGQWTVVDDGLSRNGTFLNGERIAGRRQLRDGDELRLGETVEEVFLSVDAVKGHLRTLFDRFGLGDVPQIQKRVRLVELALQRGLISVRDL